MKKAVKAVVVAMTLCLLCGLALAQGGNSGSSFTDPRDGKKYRTVKIGEQVWMAENLNYSGSGSTGMCYGIKPDNCAKYGRLYNWYEAMDIINLPLSCDSRVSDCTDQMRSKRQGICPVGWHLPRHLEWYDLIEAVGGSYFAGAKLKSQTGWNDYQGESGNGTDDFGFSALPGGFRQTGGRSGGFYNVGTGGIWWSATEYTSLEAFTRFMINGSELVHEAYFTKDDVFSVRCIRD